MIEIVAGGIYAMSTDNYIKVDPSWDGVSETVPVREWSKLTGDGPLMSFGIGVMRDHAIRRVLDLEDGDNLTITDDVQGGLEIIGGESVKISGGKTVGDLVIRGVSGGKGKK